MSILVRIRVDDKAIPELMKLGKIAGLTEAKVKPLGATLKNVFAGAGMIWGLNELRRGMTAVVSEIGKFDFNMRRIEGIGGITGKSLEKVSDGARKLATEIEFSASKISEAMLEMVKQGFEDPDKLLEAFPSIANLATAAVMDLNYAANNTLATMKAFGMGMTETSRVSNVLATVLNKTAADAEDFMEGMKYAGAVAKETGASFEETSAVLGVLSDAGIRGTMAGTSLRTMMIKLLKPSGAVAKEFRTMRLEGKNLGEIMNELKKRGLGLTDLLDTFDKRAITSASVLSGDKVLEKLNKLTPALYDQLIKAKDASDTIRMALIPSLMNLVNNINEVGMSIFDAFGDKPSDAIAGVVKQVQKLDAVIDANQDVIAAWGDRFKKIFDIAVKLAGGILLTLVNNIETVTTVAAALIGLKALGGVVGVLKGVQSMLTTTNWSGSWTGFTNAITATVMVVAGLQIAINEIFNTINKNLDAQNKAVGSGSTADLEKRMDSLYKIAQAMDDLDRIKNRPPAPRAQALRTYADMQEALAKLDALKAGYLKYGKYAVERDLKSSEAARNYADNLLKILGARKRLAEENAKIKKGETGGTNRVDPDLSNADDKTAAALKKLEDEAMGWVKQRDTNDLDAFSDTIKEIEKLESEALKWVEQRDNNTFEMWQKEQESIDLMVDSYWSMGQSTVDIIETINQKKLQSTIDNLEAEKAAIEDRYNGEINSASTSAFKKEMLEQRKAKAVEEADKKIAASKKELARRQRFIDNAQATANTFRAIIGTIADTPGGPITRTAAGVSIGAILAGYLAQMMAINYREGSKGPITGSGNTSSDSILIRASKGERLVSNQEMDKLGGNEQLQQMIDRGSSHTTNGSTNVYVDTVIGTPHFVRDFLMPSIKRELHR